MIGLLVKLYDSSRNGLFWSSDEEALLVKFWNEGKSINEMVNELRRNDRAVAHRLIGVGAIGYVENELPQRHGLEWSLPEIGQLRREFASNMSIDMIAKNHRRLRNAILHKAITLRLFDITNADLLRSYSDDTNKQTGYRQSGASSQSPPPPSSGLDPWKVLEVNRNMPKEAIIASYKRLCKKWHPDMWPPELSVEQRKTIDDKMKEIMEAYGLLREQGVV